MGRSRGGLTSKVHAVVDARGLPVRLGLTPGETHDNRLCPVLLAGLRCPQTMVLADRGYFNGPQIKACHDAGLTPIVPKPMTSNAKADGRFDRADFIYMAKDDEYQCPAGQRAIYRYTGEEHGLQLRRYWTSACLRISAQRGR